MIAVQIETSGMPTITITTLFPADMTRNVSREPAKLTTRASFERCLSNGGITSTKYLHRIVPSYNFTNQQSGTTGPAENCPVTVAIVDKKNTF